MAFLHLLNCLLLTYAPVFLLYNATSLQDSGAYICFGGLGGYILSSMLKLVAYATFIPSGDEFSLFSEFLKESVSFIDLFMITYVFTWKLSRTVDKKTRVFGIGLGWAAADLLFSHFLIFVFNAGGGEFSWEYLQRAILANLSLFQGIVTVCLVSTLNGSKGFTKGLIGSILIGQVLARPILSELAIQSGVLSVWTGLVAQGIWTGLFVLIGKLLVD